MLGKLARQHDPNVLVGFDHADDAGVYQIAPDTALVQTVDFFTPIVDDPYTYGQIAAANSLSDIFAMGARPMTALNIVGFPDDQLDLARIEARRGKDFLVEPVSLHTLVQETVADFKPPADRESPQVAVTSQAETDGVFAQQFFRAYGA